MAGKDFYVWALNAGRGRHASGYYRLDVPLRGLAKRGDIRLFEDDGSFRPESKAALFHADLALFYGANGEPMLHQMQVLKRLRPAKRQGEELYPPTLIYDIDDNNDFTHPFNQAFCYLGVRDYPGGHLLKPGEDDIFFRDSETGEPFRDKDGNEMGWIDGVTHHNGVVYDIARNLQQMKVRHEIIRTAHGATVCAPSLKRFFTDVIGQKNTYVFPNTIVPEEFEDVEVVRTDPSVRILWQGGMSHWVDWYPLRDSLKVIATKYPNAKFVIFGEWFNWIHEIIPDAQVEHYPWASYESYKMKRSLLNIDINLCPLVANVFNAGKSAIKWYEASVLRKPEATLASNFGPYTEITDGETGLHYRTPAEFVEKLSLLIENPALRQTLSVGAKQWVLANRTPGATLPGLMDFYRETRARHRRDLGSPIIHTPTLDEIKAATTPLR